MSVLLPLSDIPSFVLEPGDRVVRIDGTRTAALVVQGCSGRVISLYDHRDLSGRRELSFDLSLASVRDRLGRALFQKLFPEAEQPLENPLGFSAQEGDYPGSVYLNPDEPIHWFYDGDTTLSTMTGLPGRYTDPREALADLCRQVFGASNA